MKKPNQNSKPASTNHPKGSKPHAKPRIYLDTSVISYFTSRLHKNPVIRARQNLTKVWWETFNGKADFYVSTYVLDEIAKGDEVAAQSRVDWVQNFAQKVSNIQSEQFGEILYRALGIPSRSRMDAWHLAVAALTQQDYIVSWNFKHMANVGIQAEYAEVCKRAGLATPRILTPEQMIDGKLL